MSSNNATALLPVGEPGLVSVVMATYNCGQFIGQAIESVLGQTYTQLELQIVDDGSVDDTPQVVARFLSDPRVRYQRQANAGQTVAKNRGIAASTGEFIGFCDADDMWCPEKLATQVPQFSDNERLGVVYSRAAQMDEHGALLSSEGPCDARSGRVTAHLFTTNFVPFGTALVRRRCLTELGPFDERYRMGIDWELWLRISTRYEFLFVDAVTYLYRVWSGQMSRNWRGRYEYAFRIMNDFIAAHPGLLDATVVREAWADSYVHRAELRSVVSGEHLGALGDLMRVLGRWPTYMPAWRTMMIVLLTLLGLRRG